MGNFMNRNQCLVFATIFFILAIIFGSLSSMFVPCSIESDVCEIKSTIYASFVFVSLAVVFAFLISAFLEKKH